MKKWSKKVVAVILVIAISITCTTPAFASNKELLLEDVYAQELCEKAVIDGVEYEYQYYYDKEGNQVIAVTNTETLQKDIVQKNVKTAAIYVNDTLVVGTNNTAKAGWTYIGSETITLEQRHADTAYAAAAVLAAGLDIVGLGCAGWPGVSVAIIISQLGLNFFERYVDRIVGGTVDASLYQMVSYGVVQYRLDWTYTDLSGASFGEYSTFINANPYYSLSGDVL